MRAQNLKVNDTMFVCLVRAKLIGKALEALSLEINIEDWESIKRALQNRFKEHRSEMQLLRELVHCPKNKSESCEQYGKRIRDLLDAVCSIATQNSRYYQLMAIETFIHNLDNNIGILVKITQPATLEAAIATARQEETQFKLRNPFNNSNIIKTVPPNRNNNHFNPNHNQQRSNYNPNWKYSNNSSNNTTDHNKNPRFIKKEITNGKDSFTQFKPIYQIEASEVEQDAEIHENIENGNQQTDFHDEFTNSENFIEIEQQYNPT